MLEWNKPNENLYHQGLDRGVLYLEEGVVPWNGLTGLDETGTGTASVLYRDGHIYFVEADPGDFTASVKAFAWPDLFSTALGMPQVADGLYVDNQVPRRFDLSYRSLIGSGGAGDRFGYQIHLVYNAIAIVGQKTRKTLASGRSIEEFSFDLTCVPVKLEGMRPTAHYIIDTRNMDAPSIAELEGILYGRAGTPRLPDPAELYDIMNFGNRITFSATVNGMWTGRGSRDNLIDYGDGTWTIKNVDGIDHGNGTFTLQDTPQEVQ